MKLLKWLLFLVFLFCLSTESYVFAGLGISPSLINLKHFSSGASIEKKFIISRNDPDDDLLVKVIVEGAISDWIEIDKGFEFELKRGQTRTPVTVVVKAPIIVKNGEYKGAINFVTTKNIEKSEAPKVEANLSSRVPVIINITNEKITEYEVHSITVKSPEQGKPLLIELGINNTGNVAAKPSKVAVDIFDKTNNTKIATYKETNFKTVPAFVDGVTGVSILVGDVLGIDQYWADVSVYKNEEVTKRETLFFEIRPLTEEPRQCVTQYLILAWILIIIILVATLLINTKKGKSCLQNTKSKIKKIYKKLKPRKAKKAKKSIKTIIFLLLLNLVTASVMAEGTNSSVLVNEILSPTNLRAPTVTNTKIVTSWLGVEDVVSYRVYRDNLLLASTTAVSYSDTAVRKNITYSYAVTAVSSLGGESRKSTAISVKAKKSKSSSSDESSTTTNTEIAEQGAVTQEASTPTNPSAEVEPGTLEKDKSLFDIGINPAYEQRASNVFTNVAKAVVFIVPALTVFGAIYIFIKKARLI